MNRSFLLLFALGLCPAPAQASGSFSDGNQLYRSCQLGKDADVNAVNGGYCIGFVEGVASTTDMGCFPPKVILNQVVDVVTT